jgi:hypothetical protein
VDFLCLQESSFKLNVGEWDWRFKDGIYAYSWMDSAHCQILSSFYHPVDNVMFAEKQEKLIVLAQFVLLITIREWVET